MNFFATFILIVRWMESQSGMGLITRGLTLHLLCALLMVSSLRADDDGLTKRQISTLLSTAQYGVFLDDKRIGSATRHFREEADRYVVSHFFGADNVGEVLSHSYTRKSEFEISPPFALMRHTLFVKTSTKENPFNPKTIDYVRTREDRTWHISTSAGRKIKTEEVERIFTLQDHLSTALLAQQEPSIGTRHQLYRLTDYGRAEIWTPKLTRISPSSALGTPVSVVYLEGDLTRKIGVDTTGRLITSTYYNYYLKDTIFESIESYETGKTHAQRQREFEESKPASDDDDWFGLDGL